MASWQLFTIIYLITGSMVIPVQRLVLHKDQTDPIAFVIVSQILTAILVFIFAVIHGLQMPDFSKYGLLIAAMFGLYSAGHITYAKTLKQVEASIFSTLLNTNTIWVILMGYLVLQESIHTIDVLGTLLILVSVGLLAERKGKLKLDKSIGMGLLVGLIFGLAGATWVYVGKHSDLLTWSALSFAITPLIVLILQPSAVPKMRYFYNKKIAITMVGLAAIWATSNLASLAAYQRGSVSIIAPLQETSVIITVLLAIIFLKERTRMWQKILAAIICFAGVILIIR